jgi:hypothetical protein
MFKGKVLLFSLLVLFAATALHAGDVDPCLSNWGVSCVGMRVSICPAADFEFIYDGCNTGTDYWYVYALDAGGIGIEGIPWTDYWLLMCDDDPDVLCLCSSPFAADALTDEFGYTEFSGRIGGGGCVLSGIILIVQGKTIVTAASSCLLPQCELVTIVSPDLNGDCQVNLSDLGIFGLSYNKNLGDPGFDTCCDYNDDDKCNLSDFAFVGEHYLHVCF